MMKDIDEHSTANMIFNGEKLSNFPLRFKTWKEYLLLLYLFHVVLEVLANAIRKENKRHYHYNERKLSLSLDHIIVFKEIQSNIK